jgi:hypothetical protein
MRNVITGLGLGLVVLLTGCNSGPFRREVQAPAAARAPAESPTVASLVGYLNTRAQRVQVLECKDLDLECKEGYNAVNLSGRLDCQQPRNFLLTAKVLGKDAVNIGSNDQEFWFWISRMEPPYQFHCSYDDFQRSPVNLPFPFQPDLIMEALGMGSYNRPLENYQVVEDRNTNTVQLVETTTSPQGQPVRKVTVFNKSLARGTPPIKAHILQDASGKEICAAYITEVRYDRSGTAIPRRVHIVWAAQKTELKMKLDEVTVSPTIDNERTARLFTRPVLANVSSYDLARRTIDGPSTAIQRARGQMP